MVDIAFFLFSYIVYIVTVVILMMNLLIALMGATYEDTVKNSALECAHTNTSVCAAHTLMHTYSTLVCE